MGKQEQKPTFVVRPIKPADEAAVRALWASGFYDVADDSTRSLSPVALGGPGSLTFSAPRPALAALAVAGTLRAAVAVGRRDGGGVVARSLALAALGVGGLAVLHLTVRHFIAALVAVETTGVGEMAAISDTWLVPGRRAFFVAVTHDDTVLGCAAVRVGDTEDEDVTPGVCSAWRAFYSAIGYTMWKGSLRGTNYSFWEKALV